MYLVHVLLLLLQVDYGASACGTKEPNTMALPESAVASSNDLSTARRT